MADDPTDFGASPFPGRPHPNAPRKGPVYLAFVAVVAAGAFGGLIGYGLISSSCSEEPPRLQQMLEAAIARFHSGSRSCTAPLVSATLIGALVAALGAGIVAVLVMRAMTEWRRTPPTT